MSGQGETTGQPPVHVKHFHGHVRTECDNDGSVENEWVCLNGSLAVLGFPFNRGY